MTKAKSKTTTTKATAVKKPFATKVDSAEIDDLFSVLSSKKVKVETEVDVKKEASLKEQVPVESDDASSVTQDTDEEDQSITPQEPLLNKGSRYDPSRDDFSLPPATSTAHLGDDDSDFFDSRGLKRKSRALTEDGLPIYTVSELRIGLGGGTDLCPFECNCCF